MQCGPQSNVFNALKTWLLGKRIFQPVSPRCLSAVVPEPPACIVSIAGPRSVMAPAPSMSGGRAVSRRTVWPVSPEPELPEITMFSRASTQPLPIRTMVLLRPAARP
jgi:hypothetical protein